MQENQIGERVAKLRTDCKLSRAQFGEIIGVSEQYVGRLERGLTSLTDSVIARICNATGVTSDYIIFGNVDPLATANELSGFSIEQIQITLEIALKVAKFLSTVNGNNLLIQEVLQQQQPIPA